MRLLTSPRKQIQVSGMIEQVSYRHSFVLSCLPMSMPISISISYTSNPYLDRRRLHMFCAQEAKRAERRNHGCKKEETGSKSRVQESRYPISPSPDSAVKPITTLPSQPSSSPLIPYTYSIHSPLFFPNISSIPLYPY